MYERFYNLHERPFSLLPDPDYLYLSRVHREALDLLRYGIESRSGFIVVTGEIGAGKTTLLQALLRRLDDRTVIARLVNTTLEPREVLEAIALDFGLETKGMSKPALLRVFGQFLVDQRALGRRPLVVIDEAQNLTAAALEEVRLLSNFETEKAKLLQILIVGQPNLRDVIGAPELEQFRQRVAVSYHLTALDAAETAAYIDFRLRHAAIGEPPRLPADASELIHRRSGGVPRIINVICDSALVYGYAEDQQRIDRALVENTIAELEATGVLQVSRTAAPESVVEAREIPRVAKAQDTIAAAEISARAANLEARERRITEREVELIEQSKVLAEQFRVFRSMRAEAVPAVAVPPDPPRPGSYAAFRQKLTDVRRRLGSKLAQGTVVDH